jgi:hypothetical protein
LTLTRRTSTLDTLGSAETITASCLVLLDWSHPVEKGAAQPHAQIHFGNSIELSQAMEMGAGVTLGMTSARSTKERLHMMRKAAEQTLRMFFIEGKSDILMYLV